MLRGVKAFHFTVAKRPTNMSKLIVKQNLLPLLAAFIWGVSFVAQSVGSETMQPFGFNAVRCAMAVVFLIPVSMAFDTIKKRQAGASIATGEPAEIPKTNLKDLALGGFLCGLALTIAVNLQQSGVGDSGAGKAGFITALYVVLVPVLGILLKKHVPSQVWVSAVIAVAGLYLLCIKEGFTIVQSDFYLLCCAFMFAVQIMLVDHFVKTVDGVKLSCAQFAVVSILSAICMFIFEDVPTWEIIKASAAPLIYTGVFSSGIAYTLQIIAQKDANPTVLSLLLSLEAVFATLSGAVLLKEQMMGREYIGCILMFAAVILSQLPSKSEIESKEIKGDVLE